MKDMIGTMPGHRIYSREVPNMKKRILAIVLCTAMLLALLPAAVFAEGGTISSVSVNVPYDLCPFSPMLYDSSLLTVGDPDLYKAYLWGYSWAGPDGVYLPDEDNLPHFKGGERYTLMVLIVPEDGATGLDSETAPRLPVYINGLRARFNPVCSPLIGEAPDKTTYAYEIDLQCPYANVIDIVEIFGFVPPTPGAKPCGLDDLSVPENAPYYIHSVIWERYLGDPSTNSVTEMAAGETFTDGVYYYLNVTLCPDDGYTFSAGDVTWRINGTPYNGYIDEVYSYISSPTAAKLNSTDLKAEARHIDYIDIEGLGAFYEGRTVLSAIENVTAPNAEGYTLFRNEDTCVSRVSNNTYVDDTALFLADESYRATFCARPDPGWTIDKETIWRINGTSANVSYAAEGSGYWYVKSVSLPVFKQTVLERVDIYGYIYPEIGQTAGSAVTMYVAGDLYEIVDAYWFCDTDSIHMAETDTFEAGKLYSACVVVRLRDPSFTIDDAAVFYLNGGSFPMGHHGAKTDGSYYVWTEQMEAITPTLTHMVSWYLDPADEVAVAGIEVADGDVFGLPAEPKKEGFTFIGWFTDRACTVPYDPTAPIYEDTELFPKFAELTVISSVEVTGFAAPSAGAAPVTPSDLSVPEGADYHISEVFWYEIGEDDVASSHSGPFEAGHTYGADIWVEPEEGCVFADDAAATLNGGTELFGGEGETVSEPDRFYISTRYFTVPATPPAGDCGGDPAKCPSAKFKDVAAYGDWSHNGIDFCVERGLFGGTTETTFEPETQMNRAMLVTVLWRYEGKPLGFTNTFTDVAEGEWYTDAVSWAAAKGIVNGVEDGRFDPEGTVTREQMAAILYRYSEYKNYDTTKRADFSDFPDAGSVSDWAQTAMQWAVAEKLIGGSQEGGKTYILPGSGATRAQVATILMRFVQNIAEK